MDAWMEVVVVVMMGLSRQAGRQAGRVIGRRNSDKEERWKKGITT